MPHFATEQDSH